MTSIAKSPRPGLGGAYVKDPETGLPVPEKEWAARQAKKAAKAQRPEPANTDKKDG